MTYQTLRRKADKQYVHFEDDDIVDGIELYTDEQWNNIVEDGNEPNASLYELVEVAVIPVDEMPSEEIVIINSSLEANISSVGGYAVGYYDGAMWYKSQILKP